MPRAHMLGGGRWQLNQAACGTIRADSPTMMRKPFWILLLPLLLLFSQQAELRHEYSHLADQATSCKKPVSVDTCSTCLAYAHITGTAKPEPSVAGLLTDLSFCLAAAPAVASADVGALSPRSRGPPTL